MTPQHEYLLEELIDKHGLATVLESISCICHEKAEHVRSNRQDENLATDWEFAARRVGDAADKRER